MQCTCSLDQDYTNFKWTEVNSGMYRDSHDPIIYNYRRLQCFACMAIIDWAIIEVIYRHWNYDRIYRSRVFVIGPVFHLGSQVDQHSIWPVRYVKVGSITLPHLHVQQWPCIVIIKVGPASNIIYLPYQCTQYEYLRLFGHLSANI